MKRLFAIALAGMAILACNKISYDIDTLPTDNTKLVFNITVNRPDNVATKAVKAGWADGDAVYVFFEDNTTNYVKMTFDGAEWSYEDKDGGSDYTDLSLSASGKKLTAVYLPFNDDAPVYNSGWVFSKQWSYYLSAEAVDYEVTTDPATDVATLKAVLDMTAPAGYVQFLLPADSPVAGKYALMVPYVIPATCGKIVGGSAITPEAATVSSTYTTNSYGYGEGPSATIVFPMPALTVAGEGYYFYGIVDPAKRGVSTEYTASLVEQDPTEGFAIGTQTKTFTKALYTVSAGVISSAAIKFTSPFSAQQPYVDLGLYSNLKWSTGNLVNGSIGNPGQIGDFFAWGEVVPRGTTTVWRAEDAAYNWVTYQYSYNCSATNGSKFCKYVPSDASSYWDGVGDPDNKKVLDSEDDAAYVILGSSWRIPTQAEFNQLGLCFSNASPAPDYYNDPYHYRIGTGPNGLKIKVQFGGWVAGTAIASNTNLGIFLTANLASAQKAYYMQFGDGGAARAPVSKERFGGAIVRPVVNE